MGWESASQQDTLNRLSYGAPGKGAADFSSDPSSAVYQDIANTGRAPALGGLAAANAYDPAKQPFSMPTWNGEQGFGSQWNPQQLQFIQGSQFRDMGPAATRPLEAFNWTQGVPTYMSPNAPAWADPLVNQSAYNTLNSKMTPSVPRYTDDTAFDPFTRADQYVTFSTTAPGIQDWLRNSAGINLPEQVRGEDWFGLWDTSRENWWDPRSGSLQFQYNPQDEQSWGEVLGAALTIAGIGSGIAGLGGSSLFGDFMGSIGGGNLFGPSGSATPSFGAMDALRIGNSLRGFTQDAPSAAIPSGAPNMTTGQQLGALGQVTGNRAYGSPLSMQTYQGSGAFGTI